MAIAGRASVSPRCAPITASPSISRLTTESNRGLTSTMPRGFFRWRLKHSGLRRKLVRSRHSTLCRRSLDLHPCRSLHSAGVCHHRARTPEPKAPRGIASRPAKPVLFNDIDRWVLRCALVVSDPSWQLTHDRFGIWSRTDADIVALDRAKEGFSHSVALWTFERRRPRFEPDVAGEVRVSPAT